jgi:hypothetical protein
MKEIALVHKAERDQALAVKYVSTAGMLSGVLHCALYNLGGILQR